MSDLAHTLADNTKNGYVIAPAGYGKTHLIASSVKLTHERQLILTHTYAGVNSLRNKMVLLEVPLSLYEIDTIASWSLKFCCAYPRTSNWDIVNPSTATEWKKLYKSTKELLNKKYIQCIIQASYKGLYVDEYQDCSRIQHDIILCLSQLMPCRVLGDPLQGIFGFSDELVDWEKDVSPIFMNFGKLDTPWRWLNVNTSQFSEWLSNARKKLENHEKINLIDNIPPQVKVLPIVMSAFNDPNRYRPFYSAMRVPGSYIVIYSGDQQSKNQGHNLARSLGGVFSSMEEIECKEIKKLCHKLDSDCPNSIKLVEVIQFAKKCFTKVERYLSAGSLRGEIVAINKKCKNPDVAECSNRLITLPTCKSLRSFFMIIHNNSNCRLYRRDLFNRFINILELMATNSISSYVQANEEYQCVFRRTGRPLKYPRLIGTTLLVKGLEYDHAIYIDNGHIDEKNLYVALTRASKTLTIITTKKEIP